QYELKKTRVVYNERKESHNFCAEAPKCGENSECKNWNTKATCECKNGYISAQGNSAFCEGNRQAVVSCEGGRFLEQMWQCLATVI
ncbi:hypothetical protein STEG23_020159, partial [Scotinomys teguina]